MKIKISTDSTADIPKDLLEELNIGCLPLTITHGDQEWLDGVTMTSDKFYKILDESKVLPATAAVPPTAYTDFYEQVWKDGYTDLIHTSLNSKGSATYQNAVLARTQFYEDHPDASLNIVVIDSLTYSMGYGMAVVKAARMAAEGSGPDEIVSFIQDWVDRVLPTCVVMDLKCVKKSGRITAAAAFVGDAIGLKPVIQFEGGGANIISKARGEKKGLIELLHQCKARRKPGTPYAVVYGGNDELSKTFYDMAVEAFGEEPELSYHAGCIISLNTGPNMVGIIFLS